VSLRLLVCNLVGGCEERLQHTGARGLYMPPSQAQHGQRGGLCVLRLLLKLCLRRGWPRRTFGRNEVAELRLLTDRLERERLDLKDNGLT